MASNEWQTTYTICGVTYTQGVITLGQAEEIAGLVGGVAKDIPKKIDLPGVLKFLQAHNLILKFLNILLKGEKPLADSNIPLKVAAEVIADFLSFSGISDTIPLIFGMVESAGKLVEQVPAA